MDKLNNTLCSVSEIAQLFRLDERRIQQLTKEGVIVKQGHGQYELIAAIQGYMEYLRERALISSGGGSVDYHAEKTRLTKLQADTAEVELAQARAEIVNLLEMEKEQAAIFAQLRTNVLNAVQKAVQCVEAGKREKVEKGLRGELTQVLENLAKGVEQVEEALGLR